MGHSDNKPECYGDEDYFDPDDDDCAACAVSQSCGIRVSRAAHGTRSRYATRQSSRPLSRPNPTRAVTPQRTRKNEIQRVIDEPDDDTSFAKILMHNTGLEVIQSMVDELGNSIRHIPRIDYGKYFERKKK